MIYMDQDCDNKELRKKAFRIAEWLEENPSDTEIGFLPLDLWLDFDAGKS